MREFEIAILRYLTSLQNPLLDQFAWILTFLGNEAFYFIILPFVFLCISKTTGIRLLYVFLLSVYVNSALKIATAVTRPTAMNLEGVNSLYLESAEVGSRYPHDSFPSGHAQGSTTLWGFIAYSINRASVWLTLGILIILISLARLYTAVHWLTDIVAGIAIGIMIITIYHLMGKKLSKLADRTKMTLALILPVILMFLFPEPEGFKYGGFLLGAGVAYLLEKHYVRMRIPRSWLKRLIAYGIGVVGIFALQSGLKIIFPDQSIFHVIRYASLGLWGVWITPLILVKTRLYPSY